ncbi:MAG: TetR/AcrR family transcriptional regulator [Acidimicrobiales bacterium]|nr:TetR/AcrR family transcriptional regulator [Acidimicrobiales bacterium]
MGSGATATTSNKSARTRAALAAATRAQLAATASFTAEQVAARAGTSPATFYAHFPTKDGALAAAFELTLDDLVRRTNAVLRVEALLDDGLEQTCARLVEELIEVFRADALVFRAALARMVEVRPLREAYRRSEAASLAHLERFVTRGQAAGLVTGGPSGELAELVLVLCQGVNNPRLLRTRNARPLVAGWTAALVGVLRPAAQPASFSGG